MSALAKAKTGTEIRVMVVDDSALVRGIVTRILETEPGVAVVASCANGEAALREIGRRRVDVIILDIEMPVMDGLTALPKLIAAAPGVKVLMSSTLTQRNAEMSLEALARGATDYIPKPTTSQLGGNDGFRRDLVAKIHSLAPDRAPASPRPAPSPKSLSLRAASGRRPMILAVGSSTGGPQALMTMVKALPAHIDVPIVIAQHMPPTFTTILAQHLARAGHRPCSEPVGGEAILPGRIYLAPGDFHFELVRDGVTLRAKLTKEAPENFCRPSVNPLFRSAVRLFGDQAAAVMLTGMGSDGLEASREIAAAGGPLVAQDEASSVVWGMPGAVAAAGLCSAILSLTDIAAHLSNIFLKTRS